MNVRKKALISAILAAALVFSVVALLVFRELNIPPEIKLKILSDKADLEVKNVLCREVGDSNLKWEIRADKASYLKDKNHALFDKVELKLLLSDGRTYVMTGDKGQLNTATKDMKISGNVRIVSGSGERFETERLQYSYTNKSLHTNAAVMMQTPKIRIRGVGMSISLVNKNMVLLSKVHARMK